MNKRLFLLLIVSIVFLVVGFLFLHSARGFYYVLWLTVVWLVWRRRAAIRILLQRSPFGGFVTFMGLGLVMILVEETFASVTVNILQVSSFSALLGAIPQYYANNLLLLPGFMVGWYILLRRYSYSEKEVFILVGLFGLFSEKIYVHLLTIPLFGIPLILPTMVTYIGIILPSLLSLRLVATKPLPPVVRYVIGLLFPLLVTIPFLVLHGALTQLGVVDPTVLGK